MMDSYKAAAKTVTIERIGNHVEVWVEEAEGAIRTFYIGPGTNGVEIFDSLGDYMSWLAGTA
jgi:hypothetical protein